MRRFVVGPGCSNHTPTRSCTSTRGDARAVAFFLSRSRFRSSFAFQYWELLRRSRDHPCRCARARNNHASESQRAGLGRTRSGLPGKIRAMQPKPDIRADARRCATSPQGRVSVERMFAMISLRRSGCEHVRHI